MSFEIPMQRLLEYKRLYVEVEFTEEGVFAPGEIPDGYAGSFTGKIEVVFAIIAVDASGRIKLMTYNPPEIKNKDRETGLPLELPSGRKVREGAASPVVSLVWRENTHLPEELRTITAKMWTEMEKQMEDWVL